MPGHPPLSEGLAPAAVVVLSPGSSEAEDNLKLPAQQRHRGKHSCAVYPACPMIRTIPVILFQCKKMMLLLAGRRDHFLIMYKVPVVSSGHRLRRAA